MILEKHHANKVINIENLDEVTIPYGTFDAGDALILFNNNSSSNLTVKSFVPKTYESGSSDWLQFLVFPPMSLINAIFIDSITVVFTRRA